ncbi:MAG: hypothetical protein ACKOFA_02880 [Rhodoluna sp.]
MIFRRKKKLSGIFDELPVSNGEEQKVSEESKRSGRRAMLIPDEPFNDDPGADLLLANTGKQKELWLEIIFDSEVRELRQSQIATFLEDNYRVQKWWANSIALMYLKWRAQSKSSAADEGVLRMTAIIPTTPALTYNVFFGASHYGENFNRFLKLQQDEKIVLGFKDQTRATLFFAIADSDCQLIIEHEFLKTTEARREAKRFWQELINKMIEQVSR